MRPHHLVRIAIFSIFSISVNAQDKPKIKFGKADASDFDLSPNKVSPDAAAVVIMDAGSTDFMVNKQQQFSLEFKRHKRIKLINKNGFSAATVEISLFANGSDEEKLDDFRASTYNLEGGKVSEVKLAWKDIFTEKLNKNWILKKFTFPAIKEGSIIEYAYTINSDYLFNLQPWEFQGEYPCLWSEYEISIPEYFNYSVLSQGSLPFVVNKTQQSQQTFSFALETSFTRPLSVYTTDRMINSGDKYELKAVLNIHRWAISNMTGLQLEKYTSSLENYISKIEFQLSYIKFPDQPGKNYVQNWDDVNQRLLESEDFGISLNRPNNWLDDDLKSITSNTAAGQEKAKKILSYLKNNFTCTGNGLYLSDIPRNTFKNKKGNAADINMLLISMLRHEKITADPVVLSTRNNGYANELSPLIDRFNYVICEATIDGKKYYLDATQPKLGFGNLPLKCYNGYTRVINKDAPHAVYLLADSVQENKKTTVFIENDEKGNWVGSLSSELGNYGSVDTREEITEKGKDAFFRKIKSSYTFDIGIQNTSAEPLNEVDKPMTVSYEFDLKLNKNEDIIYFNPLLAEGYKDNPFKSAERKYPVEMSYTINELYIANIDVPAGYEVEELPKPEKIKFNEDEGLYEYILQKNGNTIILQCKLWLVRANYTSEDYAGLRDFFGKIVKKQNEQFVFKKKK